MGEFFVAVLLLLGNAFFVGGEFSLIASRRTVVEPLAATSRRAKLALSAMNRRRARSPAAARSRDTSSADPATASR